MSQFIEMTGDPRTNPKGWTVKKLPELASYSIGLTYKPEQVSESGTIVLRSGNIQSYKIDLTDVVRVDCPIKESIYVQKDDILMCSRNGSAALVGKVAQIKEIHEPMTYGAFMTVIRSEYSDFLYLYFQSKDFREQVSTGKSSTMNQITQNMLDKISIPLPDGDTRKKLSDILHQADKSKFGDFKSQFIEMFGGLCQDTPWSDVVTITNGKAYPEEYQEEGAYPICGSGGIMCYGEKKLCNGNTTILGRKGNINNPIFMESGYWIVDTAFSIDVDKAKLHPKFFYYWCCQYDFTKLNKQGVLPSLTRKDLEKVKMAIPQMRDQLKFVSIAEQADKSKSVIQKALVYLNDIQSDELGKIA